MSKLAVANIIFETTEANRIEYTGNNIVRVRANGGLQIPFGTTAQRVSPEYGIIRYNTDLQTVEMYDAGGWYNMPTGGYVNSIYTVANSAYAAANNVGPQIAPAFNQANLAYTSSNVVYAAVNSAFATINADYAFTNSAYASINSNWTVTNTVYGVANAAFASANNVAPQIAPAYNTANAAFAAANTKFSSSGGTISGAVEITADLTVHGNTRFVDQQTLSVGDPLIYLAANNYSSDVVDIGFVANYVNTGGANVHTGLYRSSGTKEYYLFYGYDKEPYNNYIDPTGNNITMAVLNSTVRTSNLILGGANALGTIAAVYGQVNTNSTILTSAYGVANAAFGKANNALSNTSGTTFAGSLTITGNMITNGHVSSSAQGGNFIYPADSGYEWWTGAWNDYVSYQITRRSTSTGTGYPYFMIDTTGNVGIGTISPGSKLSVTDSLSITNSAGAQYLLMGNQDSGGVNKPGIMRSYNGGQFDWGYGTSWSGSGGTFTTKASLDNGGIFIAYGSSRAPIFYDQDNTAFYINPNSTSAVSGAILIGPNSYSEYTRIGGVGPATDYATLAASNGNLHIDSKNSYGLYLNYASSGTINMCQGGGYTYSAGSMRSPIFYDSDNTGYYLDGNNTSAFNSLNTAGTTCLLGSSGVRNLNFGANEIAWYSATTAMWLNICDSTGNNGQNYNLYIRGLATNGSASATLSSINLWATTTACSGNLTASGYIYAPGTIVQVQSARNGDFYSTSSTTWVDITGLSVDITPKSTNSKIFIMVSFGRATTSAYNLDYACAIRVLGNGSSSLNINGNTSGSREKVAMMINGLAFNADHCPGGFSCSGLESPATTSTITYKVQVRVQSPAFNMNGTPNNADSGQPYHGRSASSITVWEIAQ